MAKLGVDVSGNEGAHFKKTKQRSRSLGPPTKRSKKENGEISLNRTRSLSKPPRNEQGVKDVAVRINLLIFYFQFLFIIFFLDEKEIG